MYIVHIWSVQCIVLTHGLVAHEKGSCRLITGARVRTYYVSIMYYTLRAVNLKKKKKHFETYFIFFNFSFYTVISYEYIGVVLRYMVYISATRDRTKYRRLVLKCSITFPVV